MVNKITPYLWFNNNAEEAMNFYVSLFKSSKIISIDYYPENSTEEHLKGMNGKVINGVFELSGQRYMAIDGGPLFPFTEAVSFYVDCEDQTEVDYLWEKLTSNGGQESQCGWCKDKFGLSWQIIPKQLGELMQKDSSGRVVQAMMKMRKIIVADLQNVFDQK